MLGVGGGEEGAGVRGGGEGAGLGGGGEGAEGPRWRRGCWGQRWRPGTEASWYLTLEHTFELTLTNLNGCVSAT